MRGYTRNIAALPGASEQTGFRALGLAFLGLILLGGVTAAQSQGLTNAFGGFATSPDQPIDIQANRLDVDDTKKRAAFTGGVVARQDTFVMNSKTLEIRYAARAGAKKAATSGLGGGSTEVTHLTARGQVLIESIKENKQTARGNWAEFDVKKRIITMGDQVTLTQGKNVIRGTRLVINLATGRSSVQSATPTGSTNTGGRIRMVITPDKALRGNLKNRRKPVRKRKSNRTTSASDPFRDTRGGQ